MACSNEVIGAAFEYSKIEPEILVVGDNMWEPETRIKVVNELIKVCGDNWKKNMNLKQQHVKVFD